MEGKMERDRRRGEGGDIGSLIYFLIAEIKRANGGRGEERGERGEMGTEGEAEARE
jgi:hypothetical protein